jgi:hypothetical protein
MVLHACPTNAQTKYLYTIQITWQCHHFAIHFFQTRCVSSRFVSRYFAKRYFVPSLIQSTEIQSFTPSPLFRFLLTVTNCGVHHIVTQVAHISWSFLWGCCCRRFCGLSVFREFLPKYVKLSVPSRLLNTRHGTVDQSDTSRGLWIWLGVQCWEDPANSIFDASCRQ